MSDEQHPKPRRAISDEEYSGIYRNSNHAIYRAPKRRAVDDDATHIHPKVADSGAARMEAASPASPEAISEPAARRTESHGDDLPKDTWLTRIVGFAVPAIFVAAAFWGAASILVDKPPFNLTKLSLATVLAVVVAATLLWVVVMRKFLRHETMRRSIMLTALSTAIPGLGLLGAKKTGFKALGAFTATLFVFALASVGFIAFSNFSGLAGAAVDPQRLRMIRFGLLALGLFWVVLITGTHLVTRPRIRDFAHKFSGAAVVGFLCFAIAAPLAVGSQYAASQTNLVETVFVDEEDVQSSSRPTIEDKDDPWKDIPRLNILLLGADGSEERNAELSVRTDTIMVASIDTATGNTTIIQIPRNVQYTPFPMGTQMHEAFPDGFRGEGDPAEWFVNAIWEKTELAFPDLFAGQTYRGAEALKQGVEGITGLKMDYFVMLDIDGIQRLIDAMGGVTVNINQRLPRGGDTSGRPPNGYLEPGPNQHLNGSDAMWYARSRSSTSDYDRMARQSCLVNAIIDQANPATMLRSYEGIAAASAQMVVTDIPQQVLEGLVDLSLRVKDGKVVRVLFQPGENGYTYENPDFDAMRQAVQDGIEAAGETPTVSPSPTSDAPGESASEEAPESEPATETPAAEPTTTEPTDDPSSDVPEGDSNVEQVGDACAYNPDFDEEDN